LKAVTLYPAQIFGLADQVGTLESGKIANVIVTTAIPRAHHRGALPLHQGPAHLARQQAKSPIRKISQAPQSAISVSIRNRQAPVLRWHVTVGIGLSDFANQRKLFPSIRVLIFERHAFLQARRNSRIVSHRFCCGRARPRPAENRRTVHQSCRWLQALSKARTLTIEGTFQTPDGKAGTYTLDTSLPNRYYSELVVGDTSLIEAYNGKSAWHRTASGELATLVGADGSQLEAAGQYYNSHLVDARRTKLASVSPASPKCGQRRPGNRSPTMSGVKRHIFSTRRRTLS